jgi:hypothetical protein
VQLYILVKLEQINLLQNSRRWTPQRMSSKTNKSKKIEDVEIVSDSSHRNSSSTGTVKTTSCQGCQIFPRCDIPKLEKLPNYPKNTKYHKIYAYITYVGKFFIPRPSKIYPKRNFWYENTIPSGNPGSCSEKIHRYQKMIRLSALYSKVVFKLGMKHN